VNGTTAPCGSRSPTLSGAVSGVSGLMPQT
jgi:hypothetical protein